MCLETMPTRMTRVMTTRERTRLEESPVLEGPLPVSPEGRVPCNGCASFCYPCKGVLDEPEPYGYKGRTDLDWR